MQVLPKSPRFPQTREDLVRISHSISPCGRSMQQSTVSAAQKVSSARDRDRMLSHYPAFTFCNTLIYYIYAVATPDGTVMPGQEARRENSVARTPYVLKLASIQQIGASMKPILRSPPLSTVIHKPESDISSPCLKPGDSISPTVEE